MRIARIAVALDGSRLAETVLPAARSFAETLAAELALVHVIERAPPREVHGEAHLATRDQAQAYLDELAARIVGEGVGCATKVAEAVENDVPAALEAQARELGADLIALCAHGASNLRERVVGRIAERTLQRGSIPVLLRTARTPQAPAFELRNLLTPIEQGHDIGAAVDASRTIAGAYGATVTLLSVPERASAPAARLQPGASALAYELSRDATSEHLERLASELRHEIADVRAVVADGRPAAAILNLSQSLPADLVVLVTHARTGLSAWYDPGTVQQLLAHPDLTLLLLKQPSQDHS
jgi:nucleotide-binding universal stress UspA family protein